MVLSTKYLDEVDILSQFTHHVFMGQGWLIALIVLVISLLLLSMIFSISTYKKTNLTIFLKISFAILLYASLPLVSLILVMLSNPNLSGLATILWVVAINLSILASLLSTDFLHKLYGSNNEYTKYISWATIFSMAMYSMSVKIRWEESNWIIIYDSIWTLLPLAILVNIIFADLHIMALKNYRKTTIKTKENILVIISSGLLLLGTILISVAQLFNHLATPLYLGPITVAILLLSIGLYYNPYGLFPRDIDPQYFILTSTKMSTPILRTKLNTSLNDNKLFLYGGAMTGFLNLLADVMNHDNTSYQVLDYDTGKIIARQEQGFVAILVVKRVIPHLEQIMEQLLKFSTNIINNQMFIDGLETSLIKNKVLEMLKFGLSTDKSNQILTTEVLLKS